MKGLMEEKAEMVEEYKKALEKKNSKIFDEVTKILQDDKSSVEVKLTITKWLELGEVKLGKEASLGMESKERFEFAKLLLERMNKEADTYNEYDKASLDTMQTLIDETEKDIALLDEQMRIENDPEKLEELRKEKDRKIMKY